MSEVLVASEERSERLTRDDWVQEGLRALTEHGEPAVRVDVIAKTLKISRGSFYWHFKDRAEFLSAILKEWRESTTVFIHDYLANSGLGPAERIRYVHAISNSGDPRIPGGRIEQAVSQWATYNAEAARMLKTVHQERLAFLADILKEMGAERPTLKAEMFYSFLVGHNQLSKYVAFEPSAQADAALEILGVSVGPDVVKKRRSGRR